jgi:hypothetical protein
MYGIRAMVVTVMLGIGIAGSSVPIAATAFAAPSSSISAGTFSTWAAAQKAAGFPLMKPTQTFGLLRDGQIIVLSCDSAGKHPKRYVNAVYGSLAKGLLGLGQNNSSRRCGRTRKATMLGRYQINGASATLVGFCGQRRQPSCRSRRIELSLTWRRRGISYQAVSYNEWRATIVGFARKLAVVR